MPYEKHRMAKPESKTTEAQRIAADRLALALGVHSPFPWQLALLDRMINGDLPSAVDVPTGLGKTAVMAIWLVARAAGAKVPRRLVYVVDRRAVVDQATNVATMLREFVNTREDLKQDLGIDPEGELPISTLRGKFVDNREWLADPSVPAIVLGTVDMVGSRLLFRGYSVSSKMRPYQAGLLGVDSLIVLDEAHLVAPFERLVEAVASPEHDDLGWSFFESELSKVVSPLRFMSLSATGRDRDSSTVLGLTDEDRTHPIVGRRLAAVKRVSIRSEVSSRDLPEALAEEAWSLSGSGTHALRYIMFCTSRNDALKVQEGLKSREKKAGVAIEVELFVGGRRLYERDEAARWLDARGFFAGSEGKPDRATFVIATAAGEVGVDLDADHAVCDLVAWERMVQRLGRVNRRGDGRASVIIVPSAAEGPAKEQRDATHALLTALPVLDDGTSDASPGALTELKERSKKDASLKMLIEKASTPSPLHPPLTRATVESWSMTSLEDHTGRPDVEPWIRGWPEEKEEPQTIVVFRKNLPMTDDAEPLGKADMEAFLDAAAPHLVEQLETERWQVLDWFSRRLKKLSSRKSLKDGQAAGDDHIYKEDVVAVILPSAGSEKPRLLKGYVLETGDKKKARDDLERSLAGARLLVDVRLGGLVSGLLDADSDKHVKDVTLENAQVPFRVRRTENIHETTEQGWRAEARIPVAVQIASDEETAWLLIESRVEEPAGSEEGRSGAQREQKLDEHQEWTEQAMQQLAQRLRLPDAYGRMLAVAARLHDEGKKADAWQQAFNAPRKDGPYAKTKYRPNLKRLGYYRHELGSLPYAERHNRMRALDPALRELGLHLIAAHHGFARPLLRTNGAEEPPSRLQERAREIALRFARLERRWGPWGLAWWEALLRAADQQASRRNDEMKGERDG